MATPFSILTWKISWRKEPGGCTLWGFKELDITEDTTLMAESEEQLKKPLDEVKEESEKVGLKLNIQKTQIMASGAITSW